MRLSRPFKCFSFFTLAEKRLLKDLICGDQESLLSIWIPKHVDLETKDNSFCPKHIFCKGPMNFDLDNNINSVFAGWIVMKLSLAHLFKSAIASWILDKTSSTVFPIQKTVVHSMDRMAVAKQILMCGDISHHANCCY